MLRHFFFGGGGGCYPTEGLHDMVGIPFGSFGVVRHVVDLLGLGVVVGLGVALKFFAGE